MHNKGPFALPPDEGLASPFVPPKTKKNQLRHWKKDQIYRLHQLDTLILEFTFFVSLLYK